jgi:hypothetical protein
MSEHAATLKILMREVLALFAAHLRLEQSFRFSTISRTGRFNSKYAHPAYGTGQNCWKSSSST